MDELIFCGIDIPAKVEEISTRLANRLRFEMSDNELRSYKLGVMNTISILRGLVDDDCCVFVHIPNLDYEKEFTFDELEKLWLYNMC
jgi:hypothetical protein